MKAVVRAMSSSENSRKRQRLVLGTDLSSLFSDNSDDELDFSQDFLPINSSTQEEELPSTSAGITTSQKLQSYISTISSSILNAQLTLFYANLYGQQNKNASTSKTLNEKVKEILQFLQHACNCKDRSNCRIAVGCTYMKGLVIHQRRSCRQARCAICATLKLLYSCHARLCTDDVCNVPNCTNIKANFHQGTLRIRSNQELFNQTPDQTTIETENNTGELAPDHEDLYNKLLNNKICLCALCQKFLKAPIVMVKNIGNICYTCFHNSEHDEQSVQTNTALEFILQQLIVPCKFRLEGCQERISYVNIEEHEAICLANRVCCYLSDCFYACRPENFTHHFFRDHRNLTVRRIENIFMLTLSLEEEVKVLNLLQDRKFSVFISIVRDAQNPNILLYRMYNTTDEPCNLKFEITHLGRDSNNRKCIQLGVQPISRFNKFDECYSIDLSEDEIFSQKSVMLLIKQTYDNNVIERVRDVFECMVCKHVMTGHIFNCVTGHSFCQQCKLRISQFCPCCRGHLPDNLRNFALEALVELTFVRCVFSERGCTELLLKEEVDVHEKDCSFKVDLI